MTDLPFGRGGSSMQNLISRGICQTKLSAIQCVEEIDAGDIYLKKDFSLKEGSAKELYLKAGGISASQNTLRPCIYKLSSSDLLQRITMQSIQKNDRYH
jgi:methionyl-tRNA formyltransferase